VSRILPKMLGTCPVSQGFEDALARFLLAFRNNALPETRRAEIRCLP